MTQNEHSGEPPKRTIRTELVERLRAGDPDAGRVLNDLYRERMLRFCWGYLGSTADAEDAVQETFCRVLRAQQVPDNFSAWLYKIARNHCLNVRRSRARRKDAHPLPGASQLADSLTGHLTGLAKQEQRAHLADVVAKLSTDHREVLRLRYTEGLSRTEIAEVLDIPESVVKSRLYKGLQKLREHSSLA